ncbi:MAG: TIGR02680 family protein [Ruminococcus flavefaciens]|nr:TIGR02680 family protein [Ruminococcus flavefaciens]
MSRWKMNKLGFLNFWLYDQEEFLLHDGHILLRGNNAAGKSITTQSFVPFILDGDRRPERLDPFGSRDRKMEFYLLGDDEREESTGYLYLEFRKPDAEEYRTIGIGMRAQRGKGIDFWGFCLRDGRRIGPGGFQLYEKIGSQNLPLSKQKLRNLMMEQDPGCWAESPTVYKKMVNDQIFGFQDIRQYDQLVQLLIMVRAPKLSKDFRPTEVKKILNQSLQVLTDDDLSAMVSTMEQMDNLEDTLHGYQAAMQAARTIRNEYNRYNQYILGRKGQAYLDARGSTQRLRNQLKDEQARQSGLERQLHEQEDRQQQSKIRLEQARAQRAAMGEDDLSIKRAQLKQAQNNHDRLAEQLEQGERQLQKLEDGISRREDKLRRLTRDCDDVRSEVRQSLRELNDQNGLLLLGQEHDQYVRSLQAERFDADQRPVLAALLQRSRQIDDVLRSLQKAENAKGDYDSACQALDRTEAAVREAGIRFRDSQAQERDERDRLLEDFARWRDQIVQLEIPQDVWTEIRRALTVYRVPADWTPIRDQADGCNRTCESALRGKLLQAEHTLKALRSEQAELEQELNRIKAQPEPVPPRREQVQAMRRQLILSGIPCASFYELVDFAPDLPQKERDLLEAQLADSGLLDALVVPEEHLPSVQELLEEYPDRFLVPGPGTDDPIDCLIPDGTGRFPMETAACLRGISRSNLSAETALLPDGRFRCGMVQGRSHAETPAGFVGAAAREANRRRQIQKLEEQLEQLAAKVQSAQADAASCQAQLSQLAMERGQMPAAGELDQTLALLEQTRAELRKTEEERDRKAADEQRAKQIWASLDQESRSLSAGLPYGRTIPDYEEARDAASGYQSTLNSLGHSCQKLDYSMRAVSDEQDDIDEQHDQAADQKKFNEAARGALSVSQAAVSEIQAFLDKPENQARARRLEELEAEIGRQDQENRTAENECIRLKTELKNFDETIQRRKQNLLNATIEEQDLERYFLEDLELGLSGLGTIPDLEERARQAASKIQPADRKYTPEHMADALRSNYQRQNNSLLGYHPEIKLVFDAPNQPAHLRQRLCILLKKGGKELSLYDFIQSLQADIDSTGSILEERDRELFENILTETISHKLRARIEESGQWVQNMTALMATLTTSMGLTFRLDWKEKKSEGNGELDTAHLVTLLNKNRALLTPEDSKKVSDHFRNRVKRAREEAHVQGISVNYADLIRSVLDYRGWYEFHLFYQRGEDGKKELSDRAFNKFSGGEKAMAMYVPLFAAVSAQYLKGGESCPRLLALDEAFAGVDDQNISAMFELMGILSFDYIINSQALWGCYACVADLDIAEMHHPPNAPVVTILRYHWNGRQRTLEDAL